MKPFLVIIATSIGALANAQNVGIGTTNPTNAGLVVNTKVGSVHAMFGANTSGVSIESSWPGIHFNDYYNGGRRALMAGYTGGIELNPTSGTFSIYTTPSSAGGGAVITSQTAISITRNGNTGIGAVTPTEKLDVDGFVRSVGLKIRPGGYIELGAGIVGKEVNAGKIGYALFSTDAVDMVGASVGGAARKIRFWAEGGSRFEGPIHTNTILSYAGLTNDNITINANTTTTGFSKLGTGSMGLKTMTIVAAIAKETNNVGGSWAQVLRINIPVPAENIVSHSVVSIYENSSGVRLSFPIGGDDRDFGKGRYYLATHLYNGSPTTQLFARYDDCDLCDKNAKLILHLVYTDQSLQNL